MVKSFSCGSILLMARSYTLGNCYDRQRGERTGWRDTANLSSTRDGEEVSIEKLIALAPVDYINTCLVSTFRRLNDSI